MLIGPALPALGETAAATPAVVATSEPAHGGGGFALLLLKYRLALENLTEQLRERSAELTGGAQLFPGEMMGAWNSVTEGVSPIGLIAGLLAILAAALGARHAIRSRLAGDPLDGSSGHDERRGLRLGRAIYRAVVDLLGLVAFILVTLGLTAAFVPAGAARTFVFTYVTAALVTLSVALVSRFLLAPDANWARALPLGDLAARFLHRWFVTLAAVGSVGWLSAALLILSGMQFQAHLLLALAIGALMALLLAAMILEGRPLVAAALLGGDPAAAAPLRRRLARSWHVFAIVYVALIWALWAASIVTRGPSSIWAAVGSVLLAGRVAGLVEIG
jgi:hypothetical protein